MEFSILETVKSCRLLCQDCMETDETVQYHVLSNIATRGSVHVLVHYCGEAANHCLPEAVAIFFSLHHTVFSQLGGNIPYRLYNLQEYTHDAQDPHNKKKSALTRHCPDFNVLFLIMAKMHASIAKINVWFWDHSHKSQFIASYNLLK